MDRQRLRPLPRRGPAIGLCDQCGSEHWNQEAEAIIEEAVRREYEKLAVHHPAWGASSRKTDLSMQGRWLLSIAAKVQGEPETVVGKISFRATR